MIIVLDPGHGMANRQPGLYDSGALGPSGAREADYTLSYCLKMESWLKGLGHQVILTRRDQAQPCSLLYRIRTSRLANSDALVSVHFNASPQKAGRGFEVLWRTAGSEALATRIRDSMKAVGTTLLGTGVLERPDLAVLSRPHSVLIEFGFIDNPADFSLISDDGWADVSCKVSCTAIDAHLKI